MNTSPILKRSVAAAMASLLAGGVAQAQQQPPAAEGAGQRVLEEVTVTGTRLRRTGMETPTPVTAVNMEELSGFAPGNLIDAINWMPQFLGNSAPSNVFTFGGAAGAAFLNLRGVGTNRTLVLLDGRRVTSSNRLGVADINTFPEAMIRGMEVVTGGASAAYGSDAVSGVVNFQLDTDFTGLEAHVQAGITDRSDNETWEASLSMGTSLGERTHLIASVDYFEAARVESVANRSWYRGWGTVDVNGPGQPTVIAPDVRSRVYTGGGLIRQPGSALDMLHFVEGGVAVPFVDGDLVGATRQSGGTGYLPQYGNKYEDGTGQGSLYPETSRGSAFAYLKHDFNDAWTGFFQVIAGKNKVNFNAMGAHQEGNAWQARIYQDNAFLPESIRQVMEAENLEFFNLSRFAPTSSEDLSQARVTQDNELQSYTLGFDGDIQSWRASGYYQYGRATSDFLAHRFPRVDRLYRATDAVIHPDSGAAVCRSTLTFPDDGCVALNIFGPYSPSGEAIEYVLGDGYRKSLVHQHFAEFVLDGEIHDGWGAGAIPLAVGVSYRQDSFGQHSGPDDIALGTVPTAESQGYNYVPGSFVGGPILQFSGVGGEPIGGHFDVWEVFAETLLPLIEGRRGAQAVDLSLAARYADYSGSGGVMAWKIGLDWRLTEELRLRATRSRDTRAGTLSERFDQSGGGATATDPESGNTYSFSILSGGNPEVDPELSDTWTVGAVYQPNFLPGFGLSVDWFDVKIKDYITQIGVQTLINDCYLGAVELCARITRDPVSNEITFVENVFLNAAQARVNGVDIEASYNTSINVFRGDETLGVRVFASYLGENSITNVGVPTQDTSGTTNLPKWTGTATVTYRNGPFTGALTGRYIDSRVLAADPVPLASQVDNDHVASVFYTNLRLSYLFEPARGGEYDLYFNVVNLFDRDPPRVAGWNDFFGAGAFPPGIHDTLGRRYTAGLRVRFQ